MTLADIQPGKKARIVSIENVNKLVRRRLIDLGIMEGSIICLKNSLPFGGPYTLEADGQSIGIRRREASLIEVSNL
ncbi:FeoA family protein [Thermoactinomyces mirandus]|uniref:Ferrous iron transport protein A n=1 Tax=Thermoactinomyces mirandus TaxID=2756294 RepID=A0A7W2ARB1_9BACL|nr:FeoA family protein [Thermoactinomyces mirandus]MBA4602378.1 ferrous iron transport protein A [Thermoactinomyces mirandus]